MRNPIARAAVRLSALAAAVLAAASIALTIAGAAPHPRPMHHRRHAARHRPHAGTTTARYLRYRRAPGISRAHRSSLTAARTYTAAAAYRRRAGQAASADAVPTIEVAGTTAVQVNEAAYVPPTPDVPPLEPRIWSVHVTAAETGIDPDTIVAEPGQRISITFDNRGDPTDALVVEMPGRTVTFSGDLAGESRHTATITAPNRAGRYRFYSVTGSGQRSMTGWLIVSPTAAGASEPVFGARDMRIVARDDSLNPLSPIVVPGERLRVTYFNAGSAPHNLAFAFPGSEIAFASALAPGEMRTMTLAIPARAGRFYYYDPVAANRTRGMEGSLVIYRPRGTGRVGPPAGGSPRGPAGPGANWGTGPR